MEKLDEKQCCATLNLMPGASPAQIKEAYRKLAQQWHPDKYTNNPELQADAQEKIKKINAAYKFLKECKPEANNPTQTKQENSAGSGKQNADQAERRKQEVERLKRQAEQYQQEVKRREAERQGQAERQKEKASQKNEQRWRQEAEQREQQAEKDRRTAQARWRRDEDERLRRQKREAEAVHEREHLTQARKNLKPATHHFHQGKCLKCGRSKTSLAFYPGSPCL